MKIITKPNHTLRYCETTPKTQKFNLQKEVFKLLYQTKIFESSEFKDYLQKLKKNIDNVKTEDIPLTYNPITEEKPKSPEIKLKKGNNLNQILQRLNKRLTKAEITELVKAYLNNEWRNISIPQYRLISLIQHLSKPNYYYLTKEDMKRLHATKPYVLWKNVLEKSETLTTYVEHSTKKVYLVSESLSWKKLRHIIFHKAKEHKLISGFKPYKHKYGMIQKHSIYYVKKNENNEITDIIEKTIDLNKKWYLVTSVWDKGLNSDVKQDIYFKPYRNLFIQKQKENQLFLQKWLKTSKFAQKLGLNESNIRKDLI